VARVPTIPSSTWPSKLRVKSKGEPSGTFGFVQADLLEDKEETVEVPIEPEKPATPVTPHATPVTPVTPNATPVTPASAGTPESTPAAGTPDASSGTGTPAAGEKMEQDPAVPTDSPVDTEMKEEVKPKTRLEVRKFTHETKLTLEVVYPGCLDPKVVEAFRMDECEMRRHDELVIGTANAKNALETFAYWATEQISGQWKEFGSKEEFAALEDVCSKTTMWLYDEGADVTKEEYEAKLAAIKVFSDPIRLRLEAKREAELAAIKAEEDRIKAEKLAAEERVKAEKAAAEKAAAEEKAAQEKAKAEATQGEEKMATEPVEPKADDKMQTEPTVD